MQARVLQPLALSMSTSALVIGAGCCSSKKKYGSFISTSRRDSAVGARKGYPKRLANGATAKLALLPQGASTRSTLSLPISFS